MYISIKHTVIFVSYFLLTILFAQTMSTTVLDPVITTVIDRVEAEENIGDPLFLDPVDMVALRGSTGDNTFAFIVDIGWHRVIYGKTKTYNTVWEYMKSIGSFGTSDTEAKFRYPTAIASDIINNDNDRYVYIADSWNNQVVQMLFSPSSQIMTFVRNITGFQYPKDVDVHNNGTKTDGSDDWLWVLDYSGKSIYEINNDGTERAHHSSYRNNSGSLVPFRYPKKFAIKQTGSGNDQNVIYVLEDNGKTVLGLSINAPDGYLQEIFSNSFSEGTTITNIESDDRGDILLVEYDNHLFHKLSSQGEYFCSYGGYSLDYEGFKYPQVVTNIRGKDIIAIGEGWSDNSGGKIYYSGADVLNMSINQTVETFDATVQYTLTNWCDVTTNILRSSGELVETIVNDQTLASGLQTHEITLPGPGYYTLEVRADPLHTTIPDPIHTFDFTIEMPSEVSGVIEITEDLTIPAQSTLTILPGSELLFGDGVILSVEGTLQVSGEDGNPVTLTSSALENWGGIAVQPGGTIEIEHAVIENANRGVSFFWNFWSGIQSQASHITNTVFQNNSVNILYYYWFSEPALVAPLTIDKCTFSDNMIFILGTNHPITVTNCVFDNSWISTNEVYGELTIQDNTFLNYGTDVGIGALAEGNVVIEHNVIEAGTYASIYIRETMFSHSSNMNIPQSLIRELEGFRQAMGIDSISVRNRLPRDRDDPVFSIRNNTLLNSGIDLSLTGCIASYTVDIRNNIIFAESSSYAAVDIPNYWKFDGYCPCCTITLTYDYNDMYGFAHAYWANTLSGYEELPVGQGDMNPPEDPLFVNPANNNYNLQSGSPCIDSGDPTTYDPDGTTVDMGAFYFCQAIQGDVNGDREVNIFDVVVLENVILGLVELDDCLFSAGDMNNDGIIDVFDIVLLVDLILGRKMKTPFAGRMQTFNSEFEAEVSLNNRSLMKTTDSGQIEIELDSEVLIGAVHLEVLFDPVSTIIEAVTLSDLEGSFTIQDTIRGDTLAFAVYSQVGAVIDSGQTILATIHYSEPLGRWQSDSGSDGAMSLIGAAAADPQGNRVFIFFERQSESVLPQDFYLHAAYPNPFNPATTIAYDLPHESNVQLVIYDLLGREVRTLVSGAKLPGRHTIVWQGKDNAGLPVSSGVYIYRMNAVFTKDRSKTFIRNRKVVMLK